jgi:hypothetical protein
MVFLAYISGIQVSDEPAVKLNSDKMRLPCLLIIGTHRLVDSQAHQVLPSIEVSW